MALIFKHKRSSTTFFKNGGSCTMQSANAGATFCFSEFGAFICKFFGGESWWFQCRYSDSLFFFSCVAKLFDVLRTTTSSPEGHARAFHLQQPTDSEVAHCFTCNHTKIRHIFLTETTELHSMQPQLCEVYCSYYMNGMASLISLKISGNCNLANTKIVRIARKKTWPRTGELKNLVILLLTDSSLNWSL